MIELSKSIDLSKGQNVDLTKAEPGLTNITVGLGWEPRMTDGEDFDLDASCLLLAENGKIRDAGDFCYHRQMEIANGAVRHLGDNLDGQGEVAGADKERIQIDLDRVPGQIQKIPVVVAIHDAIARRQNFGQVDGAFIRVFNSDTGREIARYDLTENSSVENTLIMGEIYRKDGSWKFRSIAAGFTGKPGDISGLAEVVRLYGLNVNK